MRKESKIKKAGSASGTEGSKRMNESRYSDDAGFGASKIRKSLWLERPSMRPKNWKKEWHSYDSYQDFQEAMIEAEPIEDTPTAIVTPHPFKAVVYAVEPSGFEAVCGGGYVVEHPENPLVTVLGMTATTIADGNSIYLEYNLEANTYTIVVGTGLATVEAGPPEINRKKIAHYTTADGLQQLVRNNLNRVVRAFNSYPFYDFEGM